MGNVFAVKRQREFRSASRDDGKLMIIDVEWWCIPQSIDRCDFMDWRS